MPYHGNVKAKMSNPKKPKIKKKPVKKGMTQNQKDKLKEHSKHHTAKHMAIMRKEMKAGSSFTKAHNKAKKMVGK
jgi:hypothetical protein